MAIKRIINTGCGPVKDKVRWGHVCELDKRKRVGSPGYHAYPTRLKHLHAWREMHALAGSHMPVRMSGTRKQVRPSSNMSLAQKEQFVRSRRA